MTLRRQLSLVVILFIAVGFGLMMWVTDHLIRNHLQRELLYQMKIQTQLVDRLLPTDSAAMLRTVVELAERMDSRITILDERGEVLVDCNRGILLNTKDNLLNRPEVVDAFRSSDRFGVSVRGSATLEDEMIFTVYRSFQPRIIRVAHHQHVMDSLIGQLRWFYLLSAVLIIGLVLVATHWTVNNITRPMQEIIHSAQKIHSGEFNASFHVRSNNEIRQLADILNAMAEKFRSDIEKLQRLQEIRKDFVANASHELRTPVSSIRGYIETLQDGALHDEEVSRRFLDRALSNIERLEVIIQDMLDLSQLEKRDKQLSIRAIDVHSLLSDLKQDFEKTAEQKGLSLNLELQSPKNFRLLADPYQFEKAMMNLIDNAIKYTEKGQVTISDCLEEREYIISVRDTGVGIRKEDLPRVFERFYRADKHRSRQVGGSGLGLSIVKHIMELHKGSVRVESEIGKGSRFILMFPV